MAMRLAPEPQPTESLETSRALFHADVQNRNGVTRTEADQVLIVLDQLIAWNPPRLVHMPHASKVDRKQNVIKFGLSSTGPVFWSAMPGSVYGAKLVVLPQAIPGQEALRANIRACFDSIDNGVWRKAHPDELVPTLEFRYLRFPRDFERVTQMLGEALAAL